MISLLFRYYHVSNLFFVASNLQSPSFLWSQKKTLGTCIQLLLDEVAGRREVNTWDGGEHGSS